MPGPTYVTVPSGTTASSAFWLERSDRFLTIEVPSYGTASNVVLQWTQASGTAPFSPLFRDDGSGAPHAVFSGTAGGWGALRPPTPYGRVTLGAAQTAPMSFTLLIR